jgi:hypothetical protein
VSEREEPSEPDERDLPALAEADLARSGYRPLLAWRVQWRRERIAQRRARVRAELARNRRGDPAVPTWALVVALVVVVAVVAAVVAFA